MVELRQIFSVFMLQRLIDASIARIRVVRVYGSNAQHAANHAGH